MPINLLAFRVDTNDKRVVILGVDVIVSILGVILIIFNFKYCLI